MDIFKLHGKVLGDYSDYVHSFLNIKDEDLDARIREQLDEGYLWPPHLLQLNPAYEMGRTVPELSEGWS